MSIGLRGGQNIENIYSTTFVLEHFGAKILGPNTLITGPGRNMKLEEKYWKNAAKFAGRDSSTLNSYDQTTK